MSVSITLFNKAVFSVYNFPYPAFVTTLQIVVSIIYMLALHQMRFMDLGTNWSFKTARQASLLQPLHRYPAMSQCSFWENR